MKGRLLKGGIAAIIASRTFRADSTMIYEEVRLGGYENCAYVQCRYRNEERGASVVQGTGNVEDEYSREVNSMWSELDGG